MNTAERVSAIATSMLWFKAKSGRQPMVWGKAAEPHNLGRKTAAEGFTSKTPNTTRAKVVPLGLGLYRPQPILLLLCGVSPVVQPVSINTWPSEVPFLGYKCPDRG